MLATSDGDTILPAVSVPTALAHRPALTATAEPLLLPDGLPLTT